MIYILEILYFLSYKLVIEESESYFDYKEELMSDNGTISLPLYEIDETEFGKYITMKEIGPPTGQIFSLKPTKI